MSCLRNMPTQAEVVYHLDPSDTSLDLLSSLRSPNFKLIRTSKRIGFAAGLNLALAACKHDKVLRMDSDDITLPWRWKIQVKALDEVDFHFGSIIHKFGSGPGSILVPHYPVRLTTPTFRSIARYRNPGFHPAVAFRKKTVTDLGGYRDALAEDYDLWLRALGSGCSFERSLKPVLLYSHHPGQATAANDWEQRVRNDPLIAQSLRQLEATSPTELLEEKAELRRFLSRHPWARLEFRDVLAQLM